MASAHLDPGARLESFNSHRSFRRFPICLERTGPRNPLNHSSSNRLPLQVNSLSLVVLCPSSFRLSISTHQPPTLVMSDVRCRRSLSAAPHWKDGLCLLRSPQMREHHLHWLLRLPAFRSSHRRSFSNLSCRALRRTARRPNQRCLDEQVWTHTLVRGQTRSSARPARFPARRRIIHTRRPLRPTTRGGRCLRNPVQRHRQLRPDLLLRLLARSPLLVQYHLSALPPLLNLRQLHHWPHPQGHRSLLHGWSPTDQYPRLRYPPFPPRCPARRIPRKPHLLSPNNLCKAPRRRRPRNPA